MSANLITGNLFSPIQASQDSDYQAGTFGAKTQILNVGSKMAVSIVDNSTIRCEDGVLVTREGRRVQIDNGDVVEWTIPTGTQGTTSYYIVGFRLYTDDESAQLCDTFIQSVAGPGATIAEDTFRDGAVEIFVSVARVVQNGITLESVESLVPVATTLDQAKNEVDSITHGTCANLLNPTAQTQTINGVTFTNNGDGTYTVNGTASDVTYFILQDVKLKKGTYKLTGKQPGTTQDANAYIYTLDYKFSSNGLTDTVGTIDTDNYNQPLYMRVASGMTLTNEVIKPMITTDLNATYDDFVQYSGDGELNENVAEIYENQDNYENIVNLGEPYPTHLGVKNYIDDTGVFHQVLSRQYVKDMTWHYDSTYNAFYSDSLVNYAKHNVSNINVYMQGYTPDVNILNNKNSDKAILIGSSGRIWVRDTRYNTTTAFTNDLGNLKLFYELATPQTWNSKSEISRVSDETYTNLLNPTAQTQTINGVTFTNNGDGTYTVNGTATAYTFLNLNYVDMSTLSVLIGTYKLTGTPPNNGGARIQVMSTPGGQIGIDTGNGGIFTVPQGTTASHVRIEILSGTTCNNLIFKPMITTKLDATYDDFIPYSGSGVLNENVQKMYVDKQNKTDNALTTTAKTIVGAINELLGKFASYYTKTESDNLLANKTNTKVKGDAESTYRTGDVNLTPANIGAVAKGGDTMSGDLRFGSASVANTPYIRWRDNQHEVWAGITNSVGDWFLYDATRNSPIIWAKKNELPSFGGTVDWPNVTNKPKLVMGYAVSGQFWAASSLSKFVDTDNMMAATDGGNVYWAANAWSDERLKKNIDKTKVHGLESVNKINVVEYDFIDNKKYGGFHEIGFIAQELKKVIPDAVLEVPADDEDKEKYGTDTLLTINNSNMIPYLVKAIQELSSQVDTLTKRVEDLESKLQ